MASILSEQYAAHLNGVLSCYDWVIVTGTLPGACYAGGMTSFPYTHEIRIFDYPRFAKPLRGRGFWPHVVMGGWVHVISAMDSCPSYKPWLDKGTGHMYLRAVPASVLLPWAQCVGVKSYAQTTRLVMNNGTPGF